MPSKIGSLFALPIRSFTVFIWKATESLRPIEHVRIVVTQKHSDLRDKRGRASGHLK